MIKILCDCGRYINIDECKIIEKSDGILLRYKYNQDEGEYLLHMACECGNCNYISF